MNIVTQPEPNPEELEEIEGITIVNRKCEWCGFTGLSEHVKTGGGIKDRCIDRAMCRDRVVALRKAS